MLRNNLVYKSYHCLYNCMQFYNTLLLSMSCCIFIICGIHSLKISYCERYSRLYLYRLQRFLMALQKWKPLTKKKIWTLESQALLHISVCWFTNYKTRSLSIFLKSYIFVIIKIIFLDEWRAMCIKDYHPIISVCLRINWEQLHILLCRAYVAS
jgi:hypothetical protein